MNMLLFKFEIYLIIHSEFTLNECIFPFLVLHWGLKRDNTNGQYFQGQKLT